MLCPRCGLANALTRGTCARCGSEMTGTWASTPAGGQTPGISHPAFAGGRPPELSDVLRDGRYRLVSQMGLPETQQNQGRAWLAIDARSAQRRVVIREIPVPRGTANGAAERALSLVVQRLAKLGQQPSFPHVVDFFGHGNAFLLVSLYPEGESLASLLQRQGGALPERVVADYGHQLCGLLALMANQQPALVHGSINPETLLVSEDRETIYLLHLPPFIPGSPPARAGQVSAGYYAPEQLRGGASPSSDLYALAVTLHQAVTGYDPRTRLAMFHPPARRLNPAITPQMEQILARQLSLSPSRRYVHPSEMQRDLAALLETYPEQSENEMYMQALQSSELSEEQQREKRRSDLRLNMGVFAAICVLVLVGVIFAILR